MLSHKPELPQELGAVGVFCLSLGLRFVSVRSSSLTCGGTKLSLIWNKKPESTKRLVIARFLDCGCFCNSELPKLYACAPSRGSREFLVGHAVKQGSLLRLKQANAPQKPLGSKLQHASPL